MQFLTHGIRFRVTLVHTHYRLHSRTISSMNNFRPHTFHSFHSYHSFPFHSLGSLVGSSSATISLQIKRRKETQKPVDQKTQTSKSRTINLGGSDNYKGRRLGTVKRFCTGEITLKNMFLDQFLRIRSLSNLLR